MRDRIKGAEMRTRNFFLQKRKRIQSRSEGDGGVKKQGPGLRESLGVFGEKGERRAATAV